MYLKDDTQDESFSPSRSSQPGKILRQKMSLGVGLVNGPSFLPAFNPVGVCVSATPERERERAKENRPAPLR